MVHALLNPGSKGLYTRPGIWSSDQITLLITQTFLEQEAPYGSLRRSNKYVTPVVGKET